MDRDAGGYADDVDVDVDAEGELEHDGGGGGMTLVDAGGLGAHGVPPPSNAASSSTSALAGGGVGKRYRPAPAKTFQCRGYGECRMVFSRSEHLARHIRKHTGERPFTCHCSKQFSRLDNLRQHAQTVHADKAALNETMMRELTSLHATMTGTVPTPSATTTSSATATNADADSEEKKAVESPPRAAARRPSTKRVRASGAGAVKREPVEDKGLLSPIVGRDGNGMSVSVRPGTSTGYEGAAHAGYMDVDMDGDGDEPPTHRHRGSFRDSRDNANAVYRPDGTFRGDSFRDSSNANANGGGFREREPANGNSFRDQRDREPPNSFRSDGGSGSFRDGGFRDASHGGVFREGGFRDGEQERERERAHGLGQSFLAPASANTNNNSHSGGRGEGFRGVGPQYVRRSPPAHTPSPPTPSIGGNGNGIAHHRIASGSFSSGTRPFSSGNAAFSAANADAFPSGSSFPSPSGSAFPPGGPPFSSGNGSRPSTGSGARLPPLSAVVSASAFRPSSGHGVPAPGTTGSILLPNSLTLRRPSTSDWEWGDAWSVRPGTAPGKLAAAAAAAVDDSPFSFHPPDQPASFGFSVGGGAVGSGNPRKRTLGGPDGPYGAHPDDGDGGGGGYEYGSESRPQSRRFSVMELCNDDAGEQRPTSSVGVSSVLRSGSAERERPTTTNGLVSRASALVLHDRDQQQPQREHESRQHAGEQHFAADPFAASNGHGYGHGHGDGTRSRPGSVRGRDATAPGGSAASGARAIASGRGDGGVPPAAASGGAAFFSSAAGAGAAHRGGALPLAAVAPTAGGAGGGVPRAIRTSPGASPSAAARARDGHGLDGAGHGDDGGVSSPYGGLGPAGHGAPAGRVSLSPPASTAAAAATYRSRGLSDTGLPGGFAGVPYSASAAASGAALARTSASASPPGAYRDAPRADAPRGGGLPGIAVFARVPAYAADVPLRGDDAVVGVQRRFDDAGLRYAPGGRAEVREFAAGHGAGRGPGSPGYEPHGHGPGHRVGGGRSGGMRV